MFTKQGNKLVKTTPQPDVVVAMTRQEIENNLQWAKDRRDTKVMELAGAEQEVARLEAMLVEAEKLGVVKAKLTTTPEGLIV